MNFVSPIRPSASSAPKTTTTTPGSTTDAETPSPGNVSPSNASQTNASPSNTSQSNVSPVRRRLSAWEPLRLPLFRMFWLASLASNLGTWIHEVGAGWLMTTLDASPEMVAAVRTSMSLPIVLLAIPAGVLADRFDKRRLLLMTQVLLFSVTGLLSALTFAGWITAWGLLSLTFVMGLGMVLQVPTWQSAVPELVPRAQIPRAVALGSVSFNLARTLGPAVGGVLIAIVGIWSTFAINAFSFACVIAVLAVWKRKTTESSRGRSFWASLRQGVRFVAMHRVMRHVMIGVVLFVLPGSALWSLMPLFAKTQLGWGSPGFGIMVAMIGGGAVLGTWVLPRWRQRLGSDRLVALSMTAFAVGLAIMSFTPPWQVLFPVMGIMGAGWMATLTTLNASAQITLPPRLRARGMGCYLTMMAGSMATGSLFWGQVAGAIGLSGGFQVASAAMVLLAGVSLAFPLSTRLDD